MAHVTKCDTCGKEATQPHRWLSVREFGVISAQQPPLASEMHFCSHRCVATWAEAHILNEKKTTYRTVIGKRI